MSYILDALKKSEQERQQEKGPNLHSMHGSIPSFQNSPAKKKTKIFIWSFSAIFVCLSVLVLYYFYQGTAPIEPPSLTTTSSQQEEVLSPPPSVTSTGSTTAPLFLSQDKKKRVRIHNTDTLPVAALKPQLLPLAQDLPEEIQKKIPKITLAGHTYADDPAQRMVIINNKILREGNSLDSKIRLIEVTWEGVILDYNGTRFQQSIK